MCKIVSDFVRSADRSDGFGYFEENELALSYAQTISKSQRRKYARYGIIPASFFRYLERIKAIQPHMRLPEKARTVYVLLDLLWETPFRNRHDRSEGEILRVEILKELMPWIEKSLGSAAHLYEPRQRRRSRGKNYLTII